MPPLRHRTRVVRRAEQHAAQVDDAVPLGLRQVTAWAWRLIVIVVAGWLVVRGLSRVSTVVIPILIALLAASVLQPLVGWLRRRTNLGAMGASAVAMLGLVVAVTGMLVFAIQQLTASFSDIQAKATLGFRQLLNWVSSTLRIDTTTLNHALEQAQSRIQANSGQLVNGAMTGLSGLTTVVTGAFIALFTLFFLLAHGDRLWLWVVTLLPEQARVDTHEAFRRGWRSLGAYVRTQVIVAAVDATGIAGGAAILGLVGYAIPIWLIVFLFSFVPIIGAFLSGALAVLLVLVLKSFWSAVIMLVIVLVVQQVESHVMQPILMGRAVALHPLAVFLGVAFGGTIAGIPGALFAIPLMAFVNATGLYLSGRDPAPQLKTDNRAVRVLDRYARAVRQRAGLSRQVSPTEEVTEREVRLEDRP